MEYKLICEDCGSDGDDVAQRKKPTGIEEALCNKCFEERKKNEPENWKRTTYTKDGVS
jgi:hypothetical protein